MLRLSDLKKLAAERGCSFRKVSAYNELQVRFPCDITYSYFDDDGCCHASRQRARACVKQMLEVYEKIT